MKIVHELKQLDFGGVERVIYNIIKYDKKNEHSIIAYKDGAFRSELERVGAKIFLVNENDEDELDMEADVIHIHSGGDLSDLAKEIGLDFPVVETIHSPIRSPIPDKLIFQRVGVCDAVARLNKNAITIRNGIDFDEIQATREDDEIKDELKLNHSLPVVGRLGRIGEDKGLEDWILACYELQKKGVEFIPLIIGGEARNSKGYRGKLKLMCQSLPLKNVVWVDHRSDVSNYMQIMDIFLYPSPTEGFGLVFVEAMFNNCAVVTYRTDVTLELFGGYAVLVPQKYGIGDLADAMKRILNNEEFKGEISCMGKEFVEAEYPAERMSLEYQELYERCNVDFNGKAKSQEEHVVSA